MLLFARFGAFVVVTIFAAAGFALVVLPALLLCSGAAFLTPDAQPDAQPDRPAEPACAAQPSPRVISPLPEPSAGDGSTLGDSGACELTAPVPGDPVTAPWAEGDTSSFRRLAEGARAPCTWCHALMMEQLGPSLWGGASRLFSTGPQDVGNATC
eukprot:CAMPEP_0181182020 /NCGR_PEP_ID=MMETSP1096-20121128/7656_1 /TAXON_ID=156174 ORGANISM="Chrysochromulina ericina, Strain CCMP281" /NCGR_SAMPLE_ID=MMETSP1096 /ASSEMBLY_ACC=CAM_ASM_000453 /LENGTH=154 /DNA_ID=CAMNT_0023270579 /DNA_START=1 /DNA_END=466 /DNA_ORIENTATION=+